MPDADPGPSPAATRDAEWLARAAAGDRAAFTALVQAHAARVRATAFRFLNDGEAAEDVVQEAFIRVYRAAAEFRPDAAFTTWLYRMVVNLCWDHRRRVARARRLQQAVAQSPGTVPPTATPLEDAERTAAVRAAVAALPDRQRLAVVLHRFDGLSHAEVADVTGWSIGAVESCLVRGYAALRKSLAEWL